MNIFKVIGSSGTTFREKFTSSILAWLLNPNMEHGLGFSFMKSFVSSIDKDRFLELTNQLCPSIENNDSIESIDCMIYLEENVGTSFIDIVFTIGDRLFAIENKIYESSVCKGQLEREYRGLRDNPKFKDHKICMIYLVPIDGDFLDPNIINEFESLELKENDDDIKILMTWQPNVLNYASISTILSKVIQKENDCEIEPIHEYARHTLKAFIQFINSNFKGYESRTIGTKIGTQYDRRCTIDELKKLNKGSVGFHNLDWMIKNKENVMTHKFKYIDGDIIDKSQWIEINEFNKLVKWLIEGEIPDINWSNFETMKSDNIYEISKNYKDLYIGISGGLNKFREMSYEAVLNKRWQVCTEKNSSQWFSSEEYHDEFKRKKEKHDANITEG